MIKYKLNITYNFKHEDKGVIDSAVKAILSHIKGAFGDNPDVSLTIEGDRSGANYLAPVNEKHYKHGKVPLSEIKLD